MTLYFRIQPQTNRDTLNQWGPANKGEGGCEMQHVVQLLYNINQRLNVVIYAVTAKTLKWVNDV